LPRRIVVVGLGIALAGFVVTAWTARVGRVAQEVDIDPTSSGPLLPGAAEPQSGESRSGPLAAAFSSVAVLVSTNLQLTAFVAPSVPPSPPPPAPPPPLPPAEPVTAPAAVVASGPGDAALEALRDCESDGDYSAVSPEGWYRGAYQFSQGTWDSVASRSRPDLVGVDPAVAGPSDQDDMARAIYDEAGGSPWPHCGQSL
jgi:Transglycosylase-like domain